MNDFTNELWRKSIHLSSLWMAVAIWHLDRTTALFLFGLMLAGLLACELLRTRWTPFTTIYNKIFGRILRAHEKKKFTGAFYVVLSAFLAVLLFNKTIAITSLGIMLISDSMAALIGKKFGRTPIAGKSMEGSLAFLLSALAVVYVTGKLGHEDPSFFYSGMAAALTATITELFGKKLKIDDNLTITLTSGAVLTAGIMWGR